MADIFSPTEEKVLKIIGKQKVTISEIVREIHGDDPPYGSNNEIAAVVRRIYVKCANHKLPWTIVGVGRGRGGKTVWREKV